MCCCSKNVKLRHFSHQQIDPRVQFDSLQIALISFKHHQKASKWDINRAGEESDLVERADNWRYQNIHFHWWGLLACVFENLSVHTILVVIQESFLVALIIHCPTDEWGIKMTMEPTNLLHQEFHQDLVSLLKLEWAFDRSQLDKSRCWHPK